MTLHVMIDLETWGTGVGAAIASIGAVAFNPDNSEVPLLTFHCGISLDSAMRWGRIEPECLGWWMAPARREALDRLHAMDKVALDEALLGFDRWYTALDQDVPITDPRWGGKQAECPVWGNAASFDLVLLAGAYRATGVAPLPWPYWAERCFRTLKNLFPGLEPERAGTVHDALDDATHQARWLQAIVARHPEITV